MLRIFAVLLLTTGAAFSQDCSSGDANLLTVENWQLEKVDGIISGIDIVINVRSRAAKAFRMIDASFTFEDTLGRRISSFSFDPDLTAEPDEVVETATGYMGNEMDRALDMNPDDIRVFTCTYAVIYEDGIRETFD